MEETVQAGDERTQIAVAAPDVTQAAIAVVCPVCRTENRPGERYCADCGFLLGSEVEESAEIPEAAPTVRLVGEDGREYRLAFGTNSVGRDNADVLLPDPTVSRRHARLTLEDGAVWVEDEGSTNGTRVDGDPVPPGERRAARDGEKPRFGNVSLRLVLPPDLAESAASAAEEAEAAIPSPPRRAIALLIAADGTEYSLWEGRTTAGRRAENDLVIAGDPYVSGRHAEFLCDASGCRVTDLGSTNGTFLHGERLAPHQARPLAPGDEVRLGQSAFVLQMAVDTGEDRSEEPAESDEADTGQE